MLVMLEGTVSFSLGCTREFILEGFGGSPEFVPMLLKDALPSFDTRSSRWSGLRRTSDAREWPFGCDLKARLEFAPSHREYLEPSRILQDWLREPLSPFSWLLDRLCIGLSAYRM